MSVVRYCIDVVFKAIAFITLYVSLLALHCAI